MNTPLRARTTVIALADPPETAEANPIHGAQGAAAAGYADALVAGIHTYGWACQAILDVLGDAWLAEGWTDVRYLRPVHPGDELVTTVQGDAGLLRVETVKGEGVVVLAGTAGAGRAEWFDELERPTRVTPEPPVEEPDLVRMLLESAPVGEDFRPMGVDATPNYARAWAATRLGDRDPRWHDGDRPLLHPSFLAGRMTPLFRHNYRYGPAIHVRTQMQHLALPRSGQTIAVAARLHAAYERKGHHYHESDCWILDGEGSPLAAKRHTGIFKLGPR